MQHIMITKDYSEWDKPKITAKIYGEPETPEIIISEEKAKFLEILNDRGQVHLIRSIIDKKQFDFFNN